jgi:ATP-dependent DNA helicase RecG
MLNLESKIEELPKISKPQITILKRLGIFNIEDLLLYFPYRYLDFSKTRSIKDLKPGENVSLKVKIKSLSSRFAMYGRMALAEAVVSDDTGSIKVVWFNQPYLAKSLVVGEEIFLAGAADYYKNILQMTNPVYEKVSDFPVHTSRMVPLYRLKQGLYLKTFRNFIASVINLADHAPEVLPKEIIKTQSLLGISETVRQSHFPENDQIILETKKRLAFEEIFYNQLLAQKHKLELAQKQSFKIKFDQKLVKKFVDSLPFTLTPDQKKAAWDILQDLEKPMPMNRLLEGDVGSGKTAVALIAALQAAAEGYQVAFLAPTEILAVQHFKTIQKFLLHKFHGHEIYVTSLLTNHYSKVGEKDEPKNKLTELIKEGVPGIFAGTHALLQKGVKFKKLALVIIDEQHRFGVEQRAELMKIKKRVPHLLSLSATPIPRTLQLAVYGELDISQIKTKPLGRKSIITKLVTDENRTKAYQFINSQIKTGRQAFVITPLIEESDKLGVKSAKSEAEILKKIFPDFNIGLMHGKLKGAEKESVMKDFLENKIQILVSTSVVEVGVDVPNASVMVIEGAERFGLSQLHQFRGRVGRAEHQSYCFLFISPTTPSTFGVHPSLAGGETATAVSPTFQKGVPERSKGEVVGVDTKNDTIVRLESFTKTQDGFELAELDLKQRGFGELYGSTQSGWNFKYFDPSYTSLIKPAREEALEILKNDISLEKHPLLKQKISGKTVHFE